MAPRARARRLPVPLAGARRQARLDRAAPVRPPRGAEVRPEAERARGSAAAAAAPHTRSRAAAAAQSRRGRSREAPARPTRAQISTMSS